VICSHLNESENERVRPAGEIQRGVGKEFWIRSVVAMWVGVVVVGRGVIIIIIFFCLIILFFKLFCKKILLKNKFGG
jgi:hypothetical protein